MPLNSLTTAAAETALNAAIRRAHLPSNIMQACVEQTLHIHLTDLSQHFYLLFYAVQDDGLAVQVMSDSGQTPSASIAGSSVALLTLMQADNASIALREAEVEVSGDMAFVQQASALFKRLKPDAMHWLMQQPGSHVLAPITMGVEKWLTGFKQQMSNTAEASAEYITEEQRVAVSVNEAKQQFAAIHELRDDVARLQARIEGLAQQRLLEGEQ